MNSGGINPLHGLYLSEYGVLKNQNGGYYRRGKSHSLEKKLEVAATYLDHVDRAGGGRPNITHVGEECKVSRHFVRKIEQDLMVVGNVVPPEDIYRERSSKTPSGPGSRSLSDVDQFVLYRLYRKMPTWSLRSYVNWLFYHTGTIVSKSTVSRFFNHGFEIAGRLCKPNLVPYDKFRPENIGKGREFVKYIARIDKRRLKYGDEKSLKGKSITNKKARRDVPSVQSGLSLTLPKQLTHSS